MCIQEKLIDWAKETVNVYNSITETLNKKDPGKKWGYYTQTPLSLVSQSPDLLILGINPGAEGGKDNMTGEELLKGNPCFKGLTKKGIVKAMSEDRDDNKKRNGWALWHRLKKMLQESSKDELLDIFDSFVLSNMIFFGTSNEKQIPKIDKDKCAERTLKLIDYLEPKVVLLLGKQCRDLFNRLNKTGKLEVLIPNSIYHCMYGKSHVLAIKHTAYYYSHEEMVVVGKTIGYVLDHSEETINKECIYSSYIKEDIKSFEERRMVNKPIRKTKVDSERVVEMITSNSDFYLTKIKNDDYSLSEDLMIRITKTGNGYLAIRHRIYDVPYPNPKYKYTERYRSVFNTQKQGWNCEQNVWIAKKNFGNYGNNENEIAAKIVSEINEIVELLKNI